MTKNTKVWLNNRLVDSKDAKISVFDRGFLYGDAVFETMRSYAGLIFRLDEHLERLFGSLKKVRIRFTQGKRYLEEAVYAVIRSNGLKSASIRIAVTRGEGSFAFGRKDISSPNLVISARDFGGYPARMYDSGISAKMAGTRQNELSPLSGIKSANFLNYILARLEAEEKGFDEAILANTQGLIAEAATSNIFLVKRGRLITPSIDSGVLPGITRGVVLEMAKKLGLKVRQEGVSRKELALADEVFLTNSLAEILPVTRIDSKKVGAGKPGPITKLLRISYQKQVIREILLG